MTNPRNAFPACVRASSNKEFNEKVIHALLEKIALAPKAHLYQTLSNTYRRTGQLELAAQAAEKWVELSNDDTKATYLRNILKYEKILVNPYQSSDIQPAPFVVYSNFLDQEKRNYFWGLAQRNQTQYETAGIGLGDKNMVDEDRRVTKVLQLEHKDKAVFRKKIRPIAEQLLDRFQIEGTSIKKIEVKLTAHEEGGFFEIHHDGFEPIGQGSRHLSWIYYFHKTPKPYAGGELVIFDSTSQPESHKYKSSEYTRYIPRDNELIIFPSWFHHGVTHVEKLTNDFSANRFAVAGHVIC